MNDFATFTHSSNKQEFPQQRKIFVLLLLPDFETT